MEDDGRCRAIKKSDGERCTRHSSAPGYAFCTQHQKTATKLLGVEPWVALHLPVPCAENTKSTFQKIRTQLRKPVAKKDMEAGYIYIYYFTNDTKQNMWKIGRTNRPVHTRIKEWYKMDEGLEIRLERTFKLDHGGVKRAEHIIHLYLAYCRMYRYPLLDQPGFHTIPAGKILLLGPNATKLRIAKSKQVEWFCDTLDHILRVVEPVTRFFQEKKKPSE